MSQHQGRCHINHRSEPSWLLHPNYPSVLRSYASWLNALYFSFWSSTYWLPRISYNLWMGRQENHCHHFPQAFLTFWSAQIFVVAYHLSQQLGCSLNHWCWTSRQSCSISSLSFTIVYHFFSYLDKRQSKVSHRPLATLDTPWIMTHPFSLCFLKHCFVFYYWDLALSHSHPPLHRSCRDHHPFKWVRSRMKSCHFHRSLRCLCHLQPFLRLTMVH